jgi:hypothetical protein
VCDADTTSFGQTGKSLISEQPDVNPTTVLVHGAFVWMRVQPGER